MIDMTQQQALAELQRTALMQPPPSVAVEAVGVVGNELERLTNVATAAFAHLNGGGGLQESGLRKALQAWLDAS